MDTNHQTSVTAHLTNDEKAILQFVQQANKDAERAYWWMKEVDKESAERLGVADMVGTVLGLLQKVDNITMDITIKISCKQEQSGTRSGYAERSRDCSNTEISQKK